MFVTTSSMTISFGKSSVNFYCFTRSEVSFHSNFSEAAPGFSGILSTSSCLQLHAKSVAQSSDLSGGTTTCLSKLWRRSSCRRASALPNRQPGLRRFELFAALAIGGLVFTLLAAQAQTANAQLRLLRTPTVSTSQIAFAYANNIWTVPRSGGSAAPAHQLPGSNIESAFLTRRKVDRI